MSITYVDGYERHIRNLSRLAFYSGAQPWKLSTKAGTMVMSFPLPIPPGGALSTPSATCSAYYWRAELEDGTALVQGDCLALRLPESLHPSDTIHMSCFILNGTDGGQIYPTLAQVREADRRQDEEFASLLADSIRVGRKEASKPLLSPNELAKVQGPPEEQKQAENRLLGNMISPSTLPPAVSATTWSKPLTLNEDELYTAPDPLAEYDPTIHERYRLKLAHRGYAGGIPTYDASFRRIEFAYATGTGSRRIADWNEGPSQLTNAEMVGALEAIQRTEGTRVASLDIRGINVTIDACRAAWARVLAAKSKHADEERRRAAQRMVLGPIDDGDEVGARDAE
jgi:hypothetical protein